MDRMEPLILGFPKSRTPLAVVFICFPIAARELHKNRSTKTTCEPQVAFLKPPGERTLIFIGLRKAISVASIQL